MIDNPYYNHHEHEVYKHTSQFKDTFSQKMAVPCGRCPVCIALKQNYLVQRVQMEALSNYVFFLTLTYNNETLKSINVNGHNIKYADPRHIQDMVRYLRTWEKDIPKLRYMAVSEFGGRRHRPHWHMLVFIPHSWYDKPFVRCTTYDLQRMANKLAPLFLKYWRHNISDSRKHPIWFPNCHFKCSGVKRNYDFQYVDTITKNSDDVSFYVSKYCTKASDYVDRLKSALFFNCEPEVFKEIWSMVKPRFLFSKNFGDPKNPLVRKHIKDGISRGIKFTDYPYPVYYNTCDGSSFPLSPYYRKKFVTFEDDLIFRQRLIELSPTGIIGDQEDNPYFDVDIRKFQKWEKTKKAINARDYDLGLLFDFDESGDYNIDSLLNSDLNYGKIEKISEMDFIEADWI